MSDTFKWTEKAISVLTERYLTDGPVKLAAELGTSLASVVAKARRLGIQPTRRAGKPTEWTAEMIQKLHNLYPTADAETLVREIGAPIYTIRARARKLGLRNTTGVERRSRKKSLSCKSCDIHYFDEWSPGMAYVLGFLFADGSITKRLCDVVIGIAADDVAVLDYIKGELKSTRPYYYVEAKTDAAGYAHRESVYLTLASRILVDRLMSLGLMPRKSYCDYPFPEVPDNMMPHFVRGYFDGDGSVFISGDGSCRVSFVGAPRFITGIRDSLVRLARMSTATVVTERPKKTEHGRVQWSALEDLRKFWAFAYPADAPFCLERKRVKLAEWLADPLHDNQRQYWTDEDIQTVRDLYRVLGPAELANRLGRSQRSVHAKAKDLGLL